MRTLMIGGHLDGQMLDLTAEFGARVGRPLMTLHTVNPGVLLGERHEQVVYHPFTLRFPAGAVTVYMVEGTSWDIEQRRELMITAIIASAGIEYDE